MKKILVAGISLFLATTVSASMVTGKSLPVRCNDISERLKIISERQTNSNCNDNIMDSSFSIAGNLIMHNDLSAAKEILDIGISGLKFAKEIGCKEISTINWAINEGDQIKKAIS